MSEVRLVLKGGLGNQLFQYAAGMRVARQNSFPLVLDTVSGFCGDDRYQRTYALDFFHHEGRCALPKELVYPCPRTMRQRLVRRVVEKLPSSWSGYYVQRGRVGLEADLLRRTHRRRIIMDGYWQDPRYFDPYSEALRVQLQPSNDFRYRFESWTLDAPVVVIHVRDFDTLDNAGVNLTHKYYRNALDDIKVRLGGLESASAVILFDNPENPTVRNVLDMAQVFSKVVINPIVEAHEVMWTLALGDVAVLANSTLSWWGGWLSDAGSAVYAPLAEVAIGMAAWDPSTLVLDEWVGIMDGH